MSSYPLRTAMSGIAREKWINLLCVLTIATGLLLISVSLLVVYNVGLASSRLPEKFSVTVFLKDGVSEDGSRGIIKALEGKSGVAGAVYISKEKALEDLKSTMRDADFIFEGLETNPLPPTIEIRLRRDFVTGGFVRSLALELEAMEEVDDVGYGRDLLSVIQSVKKNTEALGGLLVAALSAGVVFVCYSTVKILLYRKKDEIETMKLLGATKGFIRSPFVIEGGILGAAGGAVCSAAMLAVYYFVYFRLADSLPVLGSLSFPPGLAYFTPAAGLFIGLAGAYAAVGRIRF